MQSGGPGTTGKTLAGRGVVDDRISGAARLSNPRWSDARKDAGAATKAALTTVTRYRAGVRPEWAKDGENDESEEEEEELAAQAAGPAIERRPDDRLGRLAARERDVKGPEIVRRRREREESDEEEEKEERPAPSGRRAQQEEADDEEDEDEIERRREMARLRYGALPCPRQDSQLPATAPHRQRDTHLCRRKQMEEQEELAKVEDEDGEEEVRENPTGRWRPFLTLFLCALRSRRALMSASTTSPCAHLIAASKLSHQTRSDC